MTVRELQAELKKRGKPSSGRKADLVKRLLEATKEEAKNEAEPQDEAGDKGGEEEKHEEKEMEAEDEKDKQEKKEETENVTMEEVAASPKNEDRKRKREEQQQASEKQEAEAKDKKTRKKRREEEAEEEKEDLPKRKKHDGRPRGGRSEPEHDRKTNEKETLKKKRDWGEVQVDEQPITSDTLKEMMNESTDANMEPSEVTKSQEEPEERVVPAPKREPTRTLLVKNFVRPFTVTAAEKFLTQTGKITRFWMNDIKTHCYVTYETTEQAIAVREAVYGVVWPPNNTSKPLIADFVDYAEAEKAPLVQEKQKIFPTTASPPSNGRRKDDSADRRREPKRQKEPEKTLEELFKKTQAKPAIFYLSLTDEQIAQKEKEREDRLKEIEKEREEREGREKQRRDERNAPPFRDRGSPRDSKRSRSPRAPRR